MSRLICKYEKFIFVFVWLNVGVLEIYLNFSNQMFLEIF